MLLLSPHSLTQSAIIKMIKNFIQKIHTPPWVAFALSYIYWTYLGCITVMEIRHDATMYQNLGSIIYRDGMIAFFQTDKSNVILLPLLISFAHHLADVLPFSHIKIQTFLQILWLGFAQFLLYKFLILLRLRKAIIFVIVLYFGFSPALVNSALSSWSEVLTYPFVLGIILLSYRSWQKLPSGNIKDMLFHGFLIAALFFGVSMAREVYEYVLFIYLFFYFLFTLKFLFSREWKAARNCLILLTSVFCLYQAFTYPYKALNFKYLGYKSLTFKGGVSVYGATYARTKKLTTQEILSFLAYIPGEHVVKKLFGEEAFRTWYFYQYDYGPEKANELAAQGVPPGEADKILYQLGIKNILRNPLQYMWMTMGEGSKMLFWESTQIGFVTYPPWLRNILYATLFKNTLRLLLFLLTTFSLYFSICYAWRHRGSLHALQKADTLNPVAALFFTLILIFANIILHAPFIIETRYALPIAPLYLMLIGFAWNILSSSDTNLNK